MFLVTKSKKQKAKRKKVVHNRLGKIADGQNLLYLRPIYSVLLTAIIHKMR